jgi:hypothetical protein
MNLLSQLGGPLPFTALAADPMFAVDANGDSAGRTIAGALTILVILGVVIALGLFMGRTARA